MNKVNSPKGIFINNIVVLICCLLFISLSYSANVWSSVKLDQLKGDQSDVIELMRLETAQALRHLSPAGVAANGSIYSAPLNPLVSNSAPALKALYGVGRNITAEVQVGEQKLKYINGNKAPLGMPEKSAPLLLISINGVCVTLSAKGEPYELCLSTR